jgi:hypothetical protein
VSGTGKQQCLSSQGKEANMEAFDRRQEKDVMIENVTMNCMWLSYQPDQAKTK